MAFGDKDIEDLILPYFCVTANLTTSKRRRPHCGQAVALAARFGVTAGVMPPFNDAGQVHVDGGVIDNFPVREMRRLGRGATIGVDIDTGGALSAGAGVSVDEGWSAWQFFRRLIWKRKETLPIPSIVRILLRSALVASAARTIEDRAAADLLITPPLKQFDLLDWTSFDAAIEIGYRATVKRSTRRAPCRPARASSSAEPGLGQELQAVDHLVDGLARAMQADADEIQRIGRCGGEAARLSASLAVLNMASM